MANAKRCDRCKKFYLHDKLSDDINAFQFLCVYFKEVIIYDKPKDLCPDCIEKLKLWLEGE